MEKLLEAEVEKYRIHEIKNVYEYDRALSLQEKYQKVYDDHFEKVRQKYEKICGKYEAKYSNHWYFSHQIICLSHSNPIHLIFIKNSKIYNIHGKTEPDLSRSSPRPRKHPKIHHSLLPSGLRGGRATGLHITDSECELL